MPDQPTNEQIVREYARASAEMDLEALAALRHPDWSVLWPQSGERLTKAATLKMAEHYPEMSGTSPKMTYKRMLGGGDVFVVEGTIDYGDGVPVSYVGIGEMRGDKVAKMTEYFANPFEAPAWRADFVERMDKVPA